VSVFRGWIDAVIVGWLRLLEPDVTIWIVFMDFVGLDRWIGLDWIGFGWISCWDGLFPVGRSVWIGFQFFFLATVVFVFENSGAASSLFRQIRSRTDPRTTFVARRTSHTARNPAASTQVRGWFSYVWYL